MEFLEAIPLIGPALAVLIPFVIVLSIVVAIHELGHLMVGRWCGIKAEVFSIGFGKTIWSRTDRHGTTWQVAILPLGGFVKFLGDMDPASAGKADEAEIPDGERHRAFHNASLYKRALTVVAGPVANFLLSFLIFLALTLSVGKHGEEPVVGDLGDLGEASGFRLGDRITSVGGEPVATFVDARNALLEVNGEPIGVVVERDGKEVGFETHYRLPPRITNISFDGAAIAAGLRPGDQILSIDGNPMASSDDVQRYLIDLPELRELAIEVKRPNEDESLIIDLTPRMVERGNPFSDDDKKVPLPTMGVGLDLSSGLSPELVSIGVGEAAYRAIWRVWDIISNTFQFLYSIFANNADISSLAGPIGIAQHSAHAAERGVQDFVLFVAFVSTAIGLFNLFPIPVLDGGHLCFYALEAIRRRPAPDVVVKYSTMAGLSLLLLLMVFVTFNNDLGLGDWFVPN